MVVIRMMLTTVRGEREFEVGNRGEADQDPRYRFGAGGYVDLNALK